MIYGIEHGSQTMLDVMEKRTTIQDNINTLKWAYEVDLPTVIQLVLCMPGENDQTIQETIDFLKECMPYYPALYKNNPTLRLGINFVQALPGTPIYEYARQYGFIGKSLEEEEEYLLRISDVNAAEANHIINYSNYPFLRLLLWRFKVLNEVNAFYLYYHHGITFSKLFTSAVTMLLRKTVSTTRRTKLPSDDVFGSLLNRNSFIRTLSIPRTFRPLIYSLILPVLAIKNSKSFMHTLLLIAEYLIWFLLKPFHGKSKNIKTSLRKHIDIKPSEIYTQRGEEVNPLRLGR
jgi:hypothetical protein